jgi:phenylalanyl-tRNA synthetase alpha chain
VPISLTSEQLWRDLVIRDLTDPSEGFHALQLLIDEAVAALAEAWQCGVRIARSADCVAC